MNTLDGGRPAWLGTSAWPYRVEFLDVEHSEVAYTDAGTGSVILLVHCGMWSLVWRDVLARLSNSFRVVTLDAPGSGLSGGTPSIEAAADAVDAVVTHLDLRDMVLGFHDLGGPAALHAARRWPDRVTGLAAINTFGWRPDSVPLRTMLALMGSPVMREIDAITGWLPWLTSTRFGVGRHYDRVTRGVFRQGMKRSGRRSFHAYLRSTRRHDYTAIHEATRLLSTRPLVTVFGARNDPFRFQAAWRQRFADVEQVVVRRGNHFPMCDDPALVADTLRALAHRARPS